MGSFPCLYIPQKSALLAEFHALHVAPPRLQAGLGTGATAAACLSRWLLLNRCASALWVCVRVLLTAPERACVCVYECTVHMHSRVCMGVCTHVRNPLAAGCCWTGVFCMDVRARGKRADVYGQQKMWLPHLCPVPAKDGASPLLYRAC